MSQIRGTNTKPELLIRSIIHRMGFRYRLHIKDLPGKPDIVFPSRKKIVFVNGCFWHKHNCEYFKWPKTNDDFWKNKIESNADRDEKNYKSLIELNWVYLIVWECSVKSINKSNSYEKILFLQNSIKNFLSSSNQNCMSIDSNRLHTI